MIPLGAVILTVVLTMAVLAGRRNETLPRAQLLAWPAGVALAFFVGALVYSGHPRSVYAENEDRFLAILLPLVAGTESLALFRPRLGWSCRLVLAGAASPILLLNSVYLQTWTISQVLLWLGGLGACLLLGWISLDRQIRHLPARTVLFGLAGVNAGAGVVLMIAGYATGGPLGIILGAALAVTALITPGNVSKPALAGAAGVGLVGLFALLVSGHFFASLGLDLAAVLFTAPLLAWVLVLPPVRKRVLLRLAVLVLEAIPVASVAGLAWRRSEEPEIRRPINNDETDYSADYEQFGK
jgi:hypothetical protein